jgi:hypothetical protein
MLPVCRAGLRGSQAEAVAVATGGGSIHIERPAEDVFAFVAEAENNPRWRSYVVDTRWIDPGPMRVGRRGLQESRILGRRYAVVAEVVVWQPHHVVVWQTMAGGATVRTDCAVEPDGDGCRLTISAEGESTNGLLRLLGPLAIAVMTRQATADLRKLSAALESRNELAR